MNNQTKSINILISPCLRPIRNTGWLGTVPKWRHHGGGGRGLANDDEGLYKGKHSVEKWWRGAGGGVWDGRNHDNVILVRSVVRYTVDGRGAKRRTSSLLPRIPHVTDEVPYQGGSEGSLLLLLCYKKSSKRKPKKGAPEPTAALWDQRPVTTFSSSGS